MRAHSRCCFVGIPVPRQYRRSVFLTRARLHASTRAHTTHASTRMHARTRIRAKHAHAYARACCTRKDVCARACARARVCTQRRTCARLPGGGHAGPASICISADMPSSRALDTSGASELHTRCSVPRIRNPFTHQLYLSVNYQRAWTSHTKPVHSLIVFIF